MKTTVDLDDRLLRRAKEAALREGTSLRAVIEAALRLALNRKSESERPRKRKIKLPISKARGGLRPGIDLKDSAELEDILNS